MFGYSHFPFSTSDTTFFNGDVFGFIFYIEQYKPLNLYIAQNINFDISINQSQIFNISRK